jgi:hypothetical protein
LFFPFSPLYKGEYMASASNTYRDYIQPSEELNGSDAMADLSDSIVKLPPAHKIVIRNWMREAVDGDNSEALKELDKRIIDMIKQERSNRGE